MTAYTASQAAAHPEAPTYDTARDWIWARLAGYLREAEWEHILIGDFNSEWAPPTPTGVTELQSRASALGLLNPLHTQMKTQGEPQETFYRDFVGISSIDHVLSTLAPYMLLGGGVLSHPKWLMESDHAPIWALYQLPHGTPLPRTDWQLANRRIKVLLDKRDTEQIELLQQQASAWHRLHPSQMTGKPTLNDRDDRLVELQVALQEIAIETLLQKKVKPSPGRYFYGDFPPALQLLKIHLHSLVRLRRLLLTIRPRQQTARLTGKTLGRYLAIINDWRQAELLIRPTMSEDELPLNPPDGDTGHTYSWWVQHRIRSDLIQSLDQDIAHLNRRCKRKYRQLRNRRIREAVHKRNANISSNRLKAAFVSLLGNQRSSYNYDTLLEADGSLQTDPVKIHRHFQRHYSNLFDNDPDSLIQRLGLDKDDLASALVWEGFLQDPGAMISAYLSPQTDGTVTSIPPRLIQEVSFAFQPPLGAHMVEDELSQIMDTPFTLREFVLAIGSGGDTSPGESGTSYRLLQVAPLTILSEILNICMPSGTPLPPPPNGAK